MIVFAFRGDDHSLSFKLHFRNQRQSQLSEARLFLQRLLGLFAILVRVKALCLRSVVILVNESNQFVVSRV
jgi:hypothetical protein